MEYGIIWASDAQNSWPETLPWGVSIIPGFSMEVYLYAQDALPQWTNGIYAGLDQLSQKLLDEGPATGLIMNWLMSFLAFKYFSLGIIGILTQGQKSTSPGND